jgi:hypothetical protein
MENNILKKFPKERIELPEEFRKIYNQHYLNNREGKYKTTSLSQKLEAWMHRKVAADVQNGKGNVTTLEIGAGTLNQLEYETGKSKVYDIVEPFKELFEGSERLKGVTKIYADISEIEAGKTYDRITTIATFEHIMDLPFVVASAAKLLNANGHLRVAIPNEGTIMWKLGTKITGREFRNKYGLDYQVLMKYEHVNTAADIEAVLDYFFESTRCSVFGISKGLAFYRFYDCSGVKTDKVNDYLKTTDNC